MKSEREKKIKERVEAILEAINQLDLKEVKKIPQLANIVKSLEQAKTNYDKLYYDPYMVRVMPDPRIKVVKDVRKSTPIKPKKQIKRLKK